MKTLFSILFFVLLCVNNITAQETFSILGDSYSTFNGYLTPQKNRCYYQEVSKKRNDVHNVKQTWWWILANECNYKLQINNSFSGSTICNTGYDNKDFTDRSFITRGENIGNPDILFIFGGTNDCWAKVPIGDFKYGNWTKDDLYMFRPAFAYMLDYLKRGHPQMRIINICNCNINKLFIESMENICKHYDVECLTLKDIDKQSNHPSIKGMRQIAKQIIDFIEQ